MADEMTTLHDYNTWELVSFPPGQFLVGCRWVFTVKYLADGTLERYKMHLGSKGYTQTYGVDYVETFYPVAKTESVRILIFLAASLG